MNSSQLDIWEFSFNINGVFSWISAFITGVLITIVSTALWHRITRDKKILSYSILSDTQLINVDKKISKKIEINYGLFKVTKLRLIEIVLKNEGKKDIDETDYKIPLTFCNLPNIDNGKINVFWEKLSITPENINADLKNFKQKLGLTNTMIKAEESITIKFLLIELNSDSSADTEIKVGGRIKDVKLIEQKNRDLDLLKPSTLALIHLSSWLTTIMLLIILILNNIFSIGFVADTLSIILAIVIILLVGLGFIIQYKYLFIEPVDNTK